MASVPAILLLIGSGRPSVLAILLLAGAGAVLWSREHPPPDTQTVRGDVPLRLLQWAVGLLPADRVDWGQAMLGELDRIEGRSERWRFALGCVAGVVLAATMGARRTDGGTGQPLRWAARSCSALGSSTSGWPPTLGTG